MSKKILKALLIVLGIALLFLAGYYLGKKTAPAGTVKIITKYEKLPPIHDTVTISKPVKVYAPIDTAKIIEKCVEDGIYAELFPEKIVETEIYMTSEDTLKIVADWATKRVYEEKLFDGDSIGTCEIIAEVQYNRLGNLEYTFTPVEKVVTKTEVRYRSFEPFVGISMYSDNRTYVEAGAFFKYNYGVSVNAGRDLTTGKNTFGLGLKYKF